MTTPADSGRASAQLLRTAIDVAALHAVEPRDGALCVFVGVVRNENRGRAVTHLEYEAYEEMALPLMDEIARGALGRWPLTRVHVVHRLGPMAIGEPSVAVAVSSPHRAEAFAACRYVIDEVKARVPIWKKEFYADGSQWLEQATPPVPR